MKVHDLCTYFFAPFVHMCKNILQYLSFATLAKVVAIGHFFKIYIYGVNSHPNQPPKYICEVKRFFLVGSGLMLTPYLCILKKSEVSDTSKGFFCPKTGFHAFVITIISTLVS